MSDSIAIGYQAYTSDGEEEFGAIRAISANGREITVWASRTRAISWSWPPRSPRSRSAR